MLRFLPRPPEEEAASRLTPRFHTNKSGLLPSHAFLISPKHKASRTARYGTGGLGRRGRVAAAGGPAQAGGQRLL